MSDPATSQLPLELVSRILKLAWIGSSLRESRLDLYRALATAHPRTDVIPCVHGSRCAPEAWIYMAGTMHGKSRAINLQRLQSQPLLKRPTKPRSARSGSERLHEGRLGPRLN